MFLLEINKQCPFTGSNGSGVFVKGGSIIVLQVKKIIRNFNRDEITNPGDKIYRIVYALTGEIYDVNKKDFENCITVVNVKLGLKSHFGFFLSRFKYKHYDQKNERITLFGISIPIRKSHNRKTKQMKKDDKHNNQNHNKMNKH